MVTKIELAWLAGIIDGEGHIAVRRYAKNGYHKINFTITNTDEGILKECYRILNKLDIFYTVCLQKKYTKTRKDCYVIGINRVAECIALSKLLMPFIKSKTKQQRLIEVQLHIQTKRRKDNKNSNARKKQNKSKTQLILFSGGKQNSYL